MNNIKKKVVILEPIDDMYETHNLLEGEGFEVILGFPVSETNKRFSEEQIIDLCKDASAIIGMAREQITRKVIESCYQLEVICKYGIGVDNIDVQAATENGVFVAIAPVHNKTVAESAFSLMLSVLKKIPRNYAHLQKGMWRDATTMGNDLSGKTVGILGFGKIGRELAKRLQGWDVEILVHDPMVTKDLTAKYKARIVGQEELLSKSDIISIHLPLTNSTRKLIGDKEFSMMKSNAVIINTSRGPVIDEMSLAKALNNKTIAGAGLDVFEKEPISKDNQLIGMENVVLLPHVAGYTFEALYRISEQSLINCLTVLKGGIPEFVINKEAKAVKNKKGTVS